MHECSGEDETKQLLSYKNIPKPIAEIMVKKGITNHDELEKFVEPSLSNLRDPFDMLDMEKAVTRIAKAVKNNEKIYIYGDYDVDGVTSTAMLYLFLKEVGADAECYIPNRLEEGYGLNIEAIEEIANNGADLIITVDCGISANVEVARAKELGLDLIITDHHRQAEELPDAYAIVNPQREECTYGFKSLAGVGVAFKLIIALRYTLKNQGFFTQQPPNLRKYLDIVTLGTVADVMPLIDENRVMVKNGLQIMSTDNVRVGISELKQSAAIMSNSIRSSDVSFKLAPRINAMGRLGSSIKSLNLLLTDDRQKARRLAEELDSENNLRREIEADILQETFDTIEAKGLANNKCIVVMGEDWHPGVIGIVASRVVDRYFRPTIILSTDGEVAKGSARSIPAFHLYNGLDSISELLLSFGGHKHAAGVKLAHENVEELSRRLNEVANEYLSDEDMIPILNIDAIITPEDINDNMMSWLQKLEPYGAGNKEPLFCMQGVTKFQQPSLIGKERNHLKCYLEKDGKVFDTIGFNMGAYYDMLLNNELVDVVFTLKHNRRDRHIQLELKGLRKADTL